jgi:hypothetical protein
MTGTISIQASNRKDGTPMLILSATDKPSKKMLARIQDDLELVRLRALPQGKADISNVCGSSSDKDGVSSMHIPLALGGVDILCLEKECKKCRNKCPNK